MTLSMNWSSRIVSSDSSITDIVAFKDELRLLEESDTGMLYPPILTYKRVDLGGAFQHFVDFINSYQMKFPTPGSYQVFGNINATIDPTPNTAIEIVKAVAFSTSEVNVPALSPEESADLVKAANILDSILEGSETVAEALRLIRAEAAGTLNVSPDGTQVTIRDANDTKDRIVADVDPNTGQRNVTATDGT